MNMRKIIIVVAISALAACSSSQQNDPFYSSLYQGKPVETLDIEEKSLSEMDAIQRGDLALRNNNTDLALYHYITALEFVNGLHRDKVLLNIAQIHSQRGNDELVEQALLMALEANPNNVDVLQKLGRDYSKKGDVEQGKIYFTRAINADQARLNNGYSITFSTPESELVKLKRDKQSPVLAYIGLGILHDLDSEHSFAQTYYRYALEIDQNSKNAMMNLGYSHYMEGKYEQATVYTMKALKFDSANQKANNNLALIYLAQNDEKNALNVFMRVMETPEALNNVGYFLMLQGKAAKAVPYFQQAIDKKPYFYKAANENLEQALLQVRTGS
ncbi:tetratricopeptide repeat protein [Vibrio alginolyticus]